MSIKNITIILFLLTLASACSTAQNKVPANLNEVFAYLDNDWNAVHRLQFKTMPESEAVSSEHFSMGLWIRNNWIRGNRNPPLIKYFKSIGLYNPDDISSVILLSYHRKLNNKPLNIKAQVDEYTAYWKTTGDCNATAEKRAVEVYNKHKVGDTVIIRMPVYVEEDGSKNATIYECPNPDWTFDPKKDLEMHGTITEKYNINSVNNVFFKVRINQANLTNLQVIGEDMIIGKELHLQLEHLGIE
ncbi:DUF6794 domain-containing protein [Mucilaginibacter psychrotolerans]|uniref:DUF6794 domain-containing protein n=1 Tax=Mucilaginibacter psychrotolerans TaxID=1524096 RepID=A0A4Y8SKA7_9SPHI|nr:DUF6794 domain-containing protein [Mucilaginibacter psychrotolerans]TFF39125.1 hypothetical protein E2R66_05730 [Mucilaginibacter psychrotolerans]